MLASALPKVIELELDLHVVILVVGGVILGQINRVSLLFHRLLRFCNIVLVYSHDFLDLRW